MHKRNKIDTFEPKGADKRGRTPRPPSDRCIHVANKPCNLRLAEQYGDVPRSRYLNHVCGESNASVR